MTAKAYYPNRLRQDRYKTVVASEFTESFPQLPEDVIRLMAGKVIDCISTTITQPFTIAEKELSEEHQLLKINGMKEVLKINYDHPTKRDQEIAPFYGTLCRYRQGGEVTIQLAKHHITDAGLQYPIDQEVELLKFIKEVATKCTLEICQATELAIRKSESAKLWVDKIPARQHPPTTQNVIQPKKNRFLERIETRTSSLEPPSSKKR